MKKNISELTALRKILLMGVFFIGVIILAVTFGIADETLPVGSNLPKIKYTDFVDTSLITSKGKPIMIMYFKPDCLHCEYELEAMNKSYKKLNMADIYLLTAEKKYIKNVLSKKWKSLSNSPFLKFGFVENEEYKQKLGITAAPAFYFFNSDEKLINKIVGELKFEKILEEIEKSGGSKHRVSGLN